MSGAEIAAHALAIAHGVSAALVCAALLYLGGLSILPRRSDPSLARGESPAFIGAAAYVLVCWFGVGLGVPVARLAVGFAAVVLLLAAVRFRRIGAAFKAHVGLSSLGWTLVFVLFYLLIYLFTMPPVTSEFLPAKWLGNIDLMTYVRYTQYVLRLGPSNLPYPDFSYLGLIYLHTPAVFYILGGVSLFFHADPLTASMPAAFALAALLGLFAARISRAVFLLPRWAAVAIGAMLLSGSFFRYIFGEYFVSTLISAPVTLFLVWSTISHPPSRLLVDVGAWLRVASAYVLLLFAYPLMLGVGIAAQGAAVLLLLVAEGQADADGQTAWPRARQNALRRALTMGAPLALVALVLFGRLAWSIGQVLSLSNPNINGWPLDLISPWAILGVPGVGLNGSPCGFCVGLEVAGPLGQPLAAATFVAIAVGLGLAYFWWLRPRTSPEQRALAGLAGGAFIAYYGFFLMTGASYQQWKFASYSALPWSFAVLAALFHLIDVSAWRRPATVFLSVVAVVTVGGNLLAHALAGPTLVTFPAGLRNIAKVNAMPDFREVSVKMDETFDGLSSWLALYLLPDKRVHVISQRNIPHEPLSYDTVSPQRPLLIQNFGCEGIGHAETLEVSDVGCLLYAPPSLVLDRPYPFSQTHLFLTFTGLGAREPEGRWNSEAVVTVNLLADIQRARLFDPAFVNLRVNPYVPPGIVRQRLSLSWGDGQHGEVSLDGPRTISLPVHRADWTGLRMWTLPVSVELPDRTAPHRMYAPKGYADAPPLGALFEEVSVSRAPTGILPSSPTR